MDLHLVHYEKLTRAELSHLKEEAKEKFRQVEEERNVIVNLLLKGGSHLNCSNCEKLNISSDEDHDSKPQENPTAVKVFHIEGPLFYSFSDVLTSSTDVLTSNADESDTGRDPYYMIVGITSVPKYVNSPIYNWRGTRSTTHFAISIPANLRIDRRQIARNWRKNNYVKRYFIAAPHSWCNWKGTRAKKPQHFHCYVETKYPTDKTNFPRSWLKYGGKAYPLTNPRHRDLSVHKYLGWMEHSCQGDCYSYKIEH